MSETAPLARAVLDFWFLPPDHSRHGYYRPEWFRKDEAFDNAIRQSFAAAIEMALSGAAAEGSEEELLARILLLDQFTRNIFRQTPRAFAGDAQARALATALVATGRERKLTPWQRCFAYLPFEHSEALPDQEKSVALFSALAAEMRHEAFDHTLDYARRHHAVIARFGRFPHRNAILGRASTAEEIDFLKQPGSSF